MSLSKRLIACVNYTDGFNKLADIGTDHALLPIHAVEQGYVSTALAIDNKEGPFVIATANVLRHSLKEKIKVVLGDGIAKIDDETDVVVISGMGGKLIADILLKDSRRNVKRFVLQSNVDSDYIRRSLKEINYKIIDELVIEENNKFYDIIIVEPGSAVYTGFEEMFGPINLKLKPYFFVKKIEKEIGQLEKILPRIEKQDQRIPIKARIQLLKEALK